ncbi:hypothetical protein ThrDRAFT_03026 [Frankia casuarinae]|jgi:hypothetical protein|uniref:Lipoprotein n=1 Tax=Frankia casuarinae (strain DSM 45818 / CECT 9043 / HFP020203 / CcI3) TaxID=106370 RepID=Q2JE42_FRACC|nr:MULTISPECIES: hypothetical protein [Frankia]ABD10450.1 hypothetical protein Francci3_1068 [Frankia casuarinae]ETA00881.1 hypothetical protein CcI6DRAFT_03702 [Frankia sp. CcI6]EYT91331.1 hypothetical protein ThrDRAFT_03026 [Frankia casuarinae]KEZ35268.1 hypothetical protein CEDDRAFT_03377 [Frankia sp. CeD]KFB03419.1 hypothetical protein ALLO2DRAFT_03836 [Frankia sp. Allo2]
MPQRTALPVLAVSLLLGLTACSDDSTTDATTASPGHPVSSSTTFSVAVPEGVFKQYTTLAKEIRSEGGEVQSGPWKIGYIVEAAEPWYEGKGGQQILRKPAADETHHIEIIPVEAATGRIVPNVPITLAVIDGKGTVAEEKTLNFYYAEFFHYANNFSIPRDGSYTLRATIGVPTFFRHGEEGHTPALASGTTATFTNVTLRH